MLYVIVESINCDGESLQEKNDIMQNIVAATIEEAGSKSMVQVANSLLDGLQIDTITPLEVRQPLFDSNCGDIESGIAIAMGYASPSASIVDKVLVLVLLIIKSQEKKSSRSV
jgi:hypothetical protein